MDNKWPSFHPAVHSNGIGRRFFRSSVSSTIAILIVTRLKFWLEEKLNYGMWAFKQLSTLDPRQKCSQQKIPPYL